MRACILFSAFFLLTSVGLGSNVGVDTILAPRGTIDSGQTIIPRCIVVNYGDSTASLWTFFAIDDGTPQGYLDSLYLPALAPAQRETLEYQPWIPRGRDSMTATAWTVCTGDTFHGDDTCRLRFLSRVKDVAVTQMINPAPDTTYDSGYVIRMQCRVWNFGNQSLRFALRFRIYEFDSTVVFEAFRYLNLIAGGSTVVTCLDSCELEPGVYVAECYAIVPGDLHPENNVKRDTFWVRGVITHDVAAGPLILNGPNPIRVGDTVIPASGSSVAVPNRSPSRYMYTSTRSAGAGCTTSPCTCSFLTPPSSTGFLRSCSRNRGSMTVPTPSTWKGTRTTPTTCSGFGSRSCLRSESRKG